MKKQNARCPMQSECEKVCKYESKERDCAYYQANARPGYVIDDQVMPSPADAFESIKPDKSDIPARANNLVYLSIDKLYPHPNNPRRDLGDLTELAESIKSRGILQNLTVIPHNESSGFEHSEGNYVVIIGHRRLAAAKLAGLTEVPCAIVDMDERTQIGTMLLENIQRSDLTVIEQAEGFQMMLDLGESVKGIADKTGFSETTVKHRVKLNDLDKKKLSEAVMRGGRIEDYVALEKIVNQKARNEVLEKIGTRDFEWSMKSAIEKQEYPARRAELLEFLKGWATHTKESCYSSSLDQVHTFQGFKLEDFKKPKDAGKTKYVYTEDDSRIVLCKKKEKAAPQKKTAAEKNYAEREIQMKELAKRAYELRSDFVKNFSAGNKYAASIYAFAMRKLMRYGQAGPDEMFKLLDIQKLEDRPGDDYSAKWNRMRDMVMEVYGETPERVMLIAAYIGFGDCPSSCYYTGYHWESRITYKKNDDLDIVYDALIKLGYELSEEEQQLRDGTHELFDKPAQPKPSAEPVTAESSDDSDEQEDDNGDSE